MGICASYRRLNAAEWRELERVIEEADDLEPHELFEVYAKVAESDELMASDRYLTIEKDWHALYALLTGDLAFPDLDGVATSGHGLTPLQKAVLGGAATPFEATYGKVRCLTTAEVREVAEALDKVSVEELQSRFDQEAFNRAKIYPNPQPGGWDIGELESLWFVYPLLVGFFREAVRRGDVVLLSSD